jgi:hypothetical protein
MGLFFLVYIHSRLSEQFSKSQAGFGINFKGTGGYRDQKAGTSSLKRVTGRISQFVSDFIEASRNFILDFLHKKTTENVKTISAHSKRVLFRILGPFNLIDGL